MFLLYGLANGYCYAEMKMVSSVIKCGFKDTTMNNEKIGKFQFFIL